MESRRSPHLLGWQLIGAFLIFGACMLALAAAMLALPETGLSKLFWSLRPEAYLQLARLGWPMVVAFLGLALVFAFAAADWFRRRYRGWLVAVTLIAVNLLGDVGQIFMGRTYEGSLGILLGGALLAYMCSPMILRVFRSEGTQHSKR